MSAKKTRQTKNSTPSPKKRTRFPRSEPARADPPSNAGAADPSAEAVSLEDGAGTMIAEALAGAAAPSEATASAPVADDGDAAPALDETRTMSIAPEAAGEGTTPPALSELPTTQRAATEATAPSSPPKAAPAESVAAATATLDTETTQRPPDSPQTKSGDGSAKKLSALDAAAKVLGEAGQPMGCREMIAAMAAKGYWSSPGGQTPEATLYSAFAREITIKGAQARFVKAGRGQFALRPTA